MLNIPYTTVILAMTADGKITDRVRSPARFGSLRDKTHLEQQIAAMDGVLFGGTTLRSYQTSLPICTPELLADRQQQGFPPQPVHIVCSREANFNPSWRFFIQGIPRWLLTTPQGATQWENRPQFERILTPVLASGDRASTIDWRFAFQLLAQQGIKKLAVLGGGELIASLLTFDLIDEFWLTVCPFILGGHNAPTPVTGVGFLTEQAKKLHLLETKVIAEEVFLHYQVIR